MSFLDALQAVEAEYQSVVYAPAKTVEQLRELFYSERISAEKVTKKNRVNASKHEIFGVVRFLKSIDSQKYTARELTEMVEKQSDLTYQVTPPKIRHLMLDYNLPYRRVRIQD